MPSDQFGGEVFGGVSTVVAGVVTGGFGFATFFFAGFFGGTVSSTTTFCGGGGGAAESFFTCARKRVNSSSLLAANFCTRSPSVRRALSSPVMSLPRL